MLILKSFNRHEMSTRIAIVNPDRCQPRKCQQECRKICPVVQMGKLCIEVTNKDRIAAISEELCNGCGLCVKRCPFEAVRIINLPSSLTNQTVHRYGSNGFKLHRLPQPRRGEVLGVVGSNGLGKSTAMKLLAGSLIPNFGVESDDSKSSNHSIDEEGQRKKAVVKYFRGSALQNYFTELYDDKLKVVIKPQYVDQIPKVVRGPVTDHISNEELIAKFELTPLLNKEVQHLSGGELQRFAIAVALAKQANVVMVDEPSSFLDIRQRINMARNLRDYVSCGSSTSSNGDGDGSNGNGNGSSERYMIIVEHDLAVLDYLSDNVCILTGEPTAYGCVSAPFSVGDGINIWLNGELPTDNLRFRDEPLVFRSTAVEVVTPVTGNRDRAVTYPAMTKELEGFSLATEAGDYSTSEIIVLLGENGLGKTTFLKLLLERYRQVISYKPQLILPKFDGSVRDLLLSRIQAKWVDSHFQSEVVKPLGVNQLLDCQVQTLSGGELQKVAMVLALGKVADIYIIDEPSSYLDSDSRLMMSKVIRRYILQHQKTAFIVEHDFMMASYLADRVIVFTGQPSVSGHASAPQPLVTGMNAFLATLQVTFRADPGNNRPRINKLGSNKDSEQKASGNYFFLDAVTSTTTTTTAVSSSSSGSGDKGGSSS